MARFSRTPFLLFALSLLPWSALAAPGQVPARRDIHGAPGGVSVRAEGFRIADLPKPNPALQGRGQSKRFPPAPLSDSELAIAKLHPPRLRASTLTQVTVDSSALGGPFLPLAPAPGIGFEGISQGAYIPSEPTVAVGPTQVFSPGNVSVTITNKDGTGRTEVDGASFFGAPASEGSISDAQCFYDALRGRFVAIAFTQGTSPSSYSNYYLAISQTSDARGSWWRYKFDMSKDGTTQTTNWSDYEGVGVSDDKLVMSGQQFSFGANSYKYPKLRVIDRAMAYSGAAVTYVDFVSFPPPPGGNANNTFVTKPARNKSPDNTIYCFTVCASGGANVALRTLTGSPSAPVLSAGSLIPCNSYVVPPDATQKSSGLLVATNDCRPTDFYWRNGVLTVAWHFGITYSSTQVSAIRLFRLRTSDQVVLQDETFGADGVFYYYPAVVADSVGSEFLGFGRSSSTEYPSAWATGRRRSESAIEPATLLKTGLSATSQSRWGDFTGIDVDETATGPGGASAWYAGQWTKAPSTFGTWINKLSYGYGVLAGNAQTDCDSIAATTGDRAPLAGATVTLKQGAATLGTTTTDVSGNYSFGYLESGTYDLVITPPPGMVALDAVAGSGGTTQTRLSPVDVRDSLTDAQASVGNNFALAQLHSVPTTTSISPSGKVVGSPAFTMTVNGTGFTACSVVRLDGSDRTTSYVGAGQLTADIPAADMLAAGTHQVRVFTPASGGAPSNPQSFSVTLPSDTLAPAVVVTSPNGGEHWVQGPGHDITWAATDDGGVDSVNVDYSLHGAAGPWVGLQHGLANTGTLAWIVPSVFTDSALVRVTAFDAALHFASDVSDSLFRIAFPPDSRAPAVTVISPNGGENWVQGSTHDIAWSAYDNAGVDSVNVDYSLHGAAGPWVGLRHGLANSGTLAWALPMAVTDSALVRVTAFDPAANPGRDVSDSLFRVAAPVVAVGDDGPGDFSLRRPSPNPSRDGMLLRFSLSAAGPATLEVVDITGRRVWVSRLDGLSAGGHVVRWNGRSDSGSPLPAGVYMVRLSAAGRVRNTRLVLVR